MILLYRYTFKAIEEPKIEIPPMTIQENLPPVEEFFSDFTPRDPSRSPEHNQKYSQDNYESLGSQFVSQVSPPLTYFSPSQVRNFYPEDFIFG